MTRYLNKKMYVVNDENIVYLVDSYDAYYQANYLGINLAPIGKIICGEFHKVQFTDEDYESIIQYFIVESMENALEENGYYEYEMRA